MKKLTAFVLSAMMVLSLAACGAKTETPADTSTPAADATKPAEVAKLTYAVEAGSAGEEVALANGYNVVSVDSQAKALMEVQAGTADAAIIDSLMAGEAFMKSKGITWPLFYTGVFYLAFVGLLTLLFSFIERKLSYFK